MKTQVEKKLAELQAEWSRPLRLTLSKIGYKPITIVVNRIDEKKCELDSASKTIFCPTKADSVEILTPFIHLAQNQEIRFRQYDNSIISFKIVNVESITTNTK